MAVCIRWPVDRCGSRSSMIPVALGNQQALPGEVWFTDAAGGGGRRCNSAGRLSRSRCGVDIWSDRLMRNSAAAQAWVMGLGAQYGVNPVIFGAIYVGAIPFFSCSPGWRSSGCATGRARCCRSWRRGCALCRPISISPSSAMASRCGSGRFSASIIAYGAWNAVRNFRLKLLRKIAIRGAHCRSVRRAPDSRSLREW